MDSLARQDKSFERDSATLYEFRVTLTDRHRAYVARWLAAGARMGLHDAHVSTIDLDGRTAERHVVIWVRENADPAYSVTPKGMRWQVFDCVHRHVLGMFPNLEAALNFIRPVLDVEYAA
jgi:hypothetical protein